MFGEFQRRPDLRYTSRPDLNLFDCSVLLFLPVFFLSSPVDQPQIPLSVPRFLFLESFFFLFFFASEFIFQLYVSVMFRLCPFRLPRLFSFSSCLRFTRSFQNIIVLATIPRSIDCCFACFIFVHTREAYETILMRSFSFLSLFFDHCGIRIDMESSGAIIFSLYCIVIIVLLFIYYCTIYLFIP